MVDRLQELERLAALHQRGTLNDQEYEQAKANVLRSDKTAKKLPPWIAPAGGLVGMVLAGFLIKPMLTSSDPGGSATTTGASSSAETNDGWTVSNTVDPLTDQNVTSLVKTFAGTAADIQATISCASGGRIKYTLASFDKAGDPVDMRSSIGYGLQEVVSFQVRADDHPARYESTANPPHSNVAILSTDTTTPGLKATIDDAAEAQRVVFALPLAHSDETIVIDQAETVTSALQPCVAIRQQQRAAREAQLRAMDEAERKARAAEPKNAGDAM